MTDLSNPKIISELIKKNDFAVRKKYGQNFLVDTNIINTILDASGVGKDDVVLEIGPGMGALTKGLLERAGRVIAVEIDALLIPILQENFRDCANLELIHSDILKLSPEEEERIFRREKKIKVVANLPYYITTPVIMKLLEEYPDIDSITVMVQKEVAERMKEGPGTKTYGALSLAVQYYSEPEIITTVSGNCFIPKPDVDSAVIRLDIYEEDKRPVKTLDPEMMFRVIKAAFGQRRKTLVNALSGAPGSGISKEAVKGALREMKKDEGIRGETLTLAEFARLAEVLSSCAKQ